MAAPLASRRWTLPALAIPLLFVLSGCATAASPATSGGPAAPAGATPSGDPALGSPSSIGLVTPASSPSAGPSPTTEPTSGFVPLDVFTAQPLGPDSPFGSFFGSNARRPTPIQSSIWLTAKSLGRVTLLGSEIGLLDPAANPLLSAGTGGILPAAKTLDVSWTRWIVEPPGYGRDEKGNRYSDLTYWNLCGPGASTVALYYWQQLTGRPDVTGTAGYFLDPYAAEGAAWPSPGPTVAVSGGQAIGTYWSGADTVSGFTAHGRGFLMYMAMQSQPATWQSPGIAVFSDGSGQPFYPTRGASRTNIQTGLNWEISGQDPNAWTNAWYASVAKADPTLARDLQVAVTLDVGRDGLPVIAAIDTYDLPNWQAGASTPHTRHAVAIVGYDNAANPPTYTYIDTCGRACNARGGNGNGQVHVVAQSAMVAAILDQVGSGFVW
jgi:hypothetical protein